MEEVKQAHDGFMLYDALIKTVGTGIALYVAYHTVQHNNWIETQE